MSQVNKTSSTSAFALNHNINNPLKTIQPAPTLNTVPIGETKEVGLDLLGNDTYARMGLTLNAKTPEQKTADNAKALFDSPEFNILDNLFGV